MQTPTPHRLPVARSALRTLPRPEPRAEASTLPRPVRVPRSLVLRPDEYLSIVAAGRRAR